MSYSRFVSTIAAVCICAGLVAGSARAEDKPEYRGLYGGAGIGGGFFDSPSDQDFSWRMNVWWRALNYASIEIGYINAGKPGNHSEIDGLHLVAVPTLPLPMGFDAYGKIGGFFFGRDNGSDANVSAGLGVAYHVWKDFGLRLDWDNLAVDDKDAVNVLTLGAFYHFSTP
jgi:hypothetical protein